LWNRRLGRGEGQRANAQGRVSTESLKQREPLVRRASREGERIKGKFSCLDTKKKGKQEKLSTHNGRILGLLMREFRKRRDSQAKERRKGKSSNVSNGADGLERTA